MRYIVGGFGVICGLVVIALVGRYGYKNTDIETDAWIAAFIYAIVTAGGLFGHPLAMRVRRKNWPAATVIFFVSAAALLLSLSNSLGAIAGRANTATTQRIANNREIRAAESELKRLTGLRDAMPAFVPTDEEAVTAAKEALRTAKGRRVAECGGNNEKRGRQCKSREEDETTATTKLSEATAAKAVTERATRLEVSAQREREKLAKLGAIVAVNEQGSALAKLFRLPDAEADFAATAQQFGMALVVELIIVACMVGWEALGDTSAPTRRVEVCVEPPAPPAPTPALRPTNVVTLPQRARQALPAPAEDDGIDPNPVIKFMLERVPKAKGELADWGDIMLELPAWWMEHSIEGEPPTPAQLGAILRFIGEKGEKAGMRIIKRGGKIFFADRKVMRLKESV
jgi:hypothetical protein